MCGEFPSFRWPGLTGLLQPLKLTQQCLPSVFREVEILLIRNGVLRQSQSLIFKASFSYSRPFESWEVRMMTLAFLSIVSTHVHQSACKRARGWTAESSTWPGMYESLLSPIIWKITVLYRQSITAFLEREKCWSLLCGSVRAACFWGQLFALFLGSLAEPVRRTWTADQKHKESLAPSEARRHGGKT